MAANPEGASAPSLGEVLPWAVPPVRPGRAWVRASDPETLRRRWARLAAADPEERRALFSPTRARTADSPEAQLPGRRGTATAPIAREPGPCPEPVRVRHGAFDRQWLLADQRLLDSARPELWRVADDAQIFLTVSSPDPPGGSPVSFSAELPVDDRSTKARGRVLPLYRRPDAAEANLAPGLTRLLAERLGTGSGTGDAELVPALDVMAWTAAVLSHPHADRSGRLPLTASPELWQEGVELGRRILWLHTFGLRCADPSADRPSGQPRMPGGRRPFVRQAVSGFPQTLGYDAEEEALLLAPDGRISPVPSPAWDQQADGERILTHWFQERTPTPPAPATTPMRPAVPRPRSSRPRPDKQNPQAELLQLPATTPATTPPPPAEPPPSPAPLTVLRPADWPRAWTTELIELTSVLALLAELHPAQRALCSHIAAAPQITAEELHQARVLPAPEWSARPASVLGHQEEGPEGQFALL